MFDRMIDTIFTSSIMTQDIIYVHKSSNTIVQAKGIINASQDSNSFFETNSSLTSLTIEIKVSDVALPQENDLVKLQGKSYLVRSHEIDSERLVWKLRLEAYGGDHAEYA